MAYSRVKLLFFAFLLLQVIITSLAQSKNGNVLPGSIISANETGKPWLSPSADFAFGFQVIQGQDLYYLSVWFNHLPDQTIAWYMSDVEPVSKGSTVTLDAQNGLVLNGPQGNLIWRPRPNLVQNTDRGYMNDDGNFLLYSSKDILWQTFFNAIDTMLPLQGLVFGSRLQSRKSYSNPSQPIYYLVFRNDGDFTLSTSHDNDDVYAIYYISHTSDPKNASNSAYMLNLNLEGYLSVTRLNNQTTNISPRTVPSSLENYYKATINTDGVFALSYHPRNFTISPGWTDVWIAPENICLSNNGSGVCGCNSSCTLVKRRPVGQYPQVPEEAMAPESNGNVPEEAMTPEMAPESNGNVPKEAMAPESNGVNVPNFTLSCDANTDGGTQSYDFVELVDVDWPGKDYEMSTDSSEDHCKSFCLEDCMCAASILRNNTCWKKTFPFSNGKVNESLSSKVFLKYDTTSSVVRGQKPKTRGPLVIVLSILLGSSVFGLIAWFGYYSIIGRKKVSFHPTETVIESNTRFFTYKELEEATNGFKHEAGRGSFGIVYRDMLPSGSKASIAVKKLDRFVIDAEKEFRAEVNTIGKTHHKNLVELLGFCDEKQHRLLVYEYMTNGTLASLIFKKRKPSWNLRTQIAIGISRALTYLHEECYTQIIHCDIKPQNILLDENYNARISDFGLAKLLVINQSKTITNIRGTKGYVAPEWFRNTPVTAKVDVYSFGVMLLELIFCKRNIEEVGLGDEDNVIILVDWVWDCFQEKRLDILVEDDLEAIADWKTMERFVKVGIWCVQEDANLRPTMRKVSLMLEGIVDVSSPPCPDPFSSAP